MAFFETIERPMHDSAIIRATIPPMTYHKRFFDEYMETRSDFKELLKYEITIEMMETTKNAIPKEVNTDIFL